jgi:3-oxoacyl-[acyl-carrier-protein] synthase III
MTRPKQRKFFATVVVELLAKDATEAAEFSAQAAKRAVQAAGVTAAHVDQVEEDASPR